MTIHFHVLPITPNSDLWALAGRSFLVNWANSSRGQAYIADQIAENITFDNGAYGAYRKLIKEREARALTDNPMSEEEFDERVVELARRDWTPYYRWVDQWLDRPTSLAIIPDAIGAPSQEQDALVKAWPFPGKGIPVWHMHLPIQRLLRLCDEHEIVAVGSSGEFWDVGSDLWYARGHEFWNEVDKRHPRTKQLHLLRGLQCCNPEHPFPWARADGSNVGQNHHRPQNTAGAMVARIDAGQCRPRYVPVPVQPELFDQQAA
jgi:hypothetical protein